jgi:hypothetical protein
VAAHHPRHPHAGARHAAIAYLGEDAPTLLPLRAGDVLVVNASRAAVRAHATSPAALAHYVDAGVRVLSSPNLHAGVIATGRWAVIGSAGASHSSTISDEAVVVTDDPEVVAAVRAFIDGIDEITEVDQVFLDNATAIWQIGRAVPLPGIGGRNRGEPDFLPTPVTRMFLWHITHYQPGAAEQHERAAHIARHGTSAGPAAKYQLEWFRIDTPGSRGRGRLQRVDGSRSPPTTNGSTRRRSWTPTRSRSPTLAQRWRTTCVPESTWSRSR